MSDERPSACPDNNPVCEEWKAHLGEVLITRDEITARVRAMAAAISRDYAGQSIVLIGVLRGIIFFMADLIREITVPAMVDFVAISRYGPTERTHGVVRFTKDLDVDIEGRHVIFVEDIIDTGFTLAYILRSLQARDPASLSICTLLDRPKRRLVEFDIAYTGFEIPDCWVVGYGMDYREVLRQLPHIVVFTPPGRRPATTHGPLVPQVRMPELAPRQIADITKQPG